MTLHYNRLLPSVQQSVPIIPGEYIRRMKAPSTIENTTEEISKDSDTRIKHRHFHLSDMLTRKH